VDKIKKSRQFGVQNLFCNKSRLLIWRAKFILQKIKTFNLACKIYFAMSLLGVQNLFCNKSRLLIWSAKFILH
jgi:hypothetical protein